MRVMPREQEWAQISFAPLNANDREDPRMSMNEAASLNDQPNGAQDDAPLLQDLGSAGRFRVRVLRRVSRLTGLVRNSFIPDS